MLWVNVQLQICVRSHNVADTLDHRQVSGGTDPRLAALSAARQQHLLIGY